LIWFRGCDIKWFKHDTDASIDAKLQEILLDYGAAGYGLYWYCIELIAKDVTPKNITFELEHDVRIIARNLNLSVKEVQDMMHRMIEIGLFDISKNKKIACVKLAYRLDDSMRKGRQIGDILDAFNTENGLVGKIPKESGKSPLDIDIDIEEDIELKIEVKENKSITTQIILQSDFDTFWSAYPKKVGKDKALSAWNKKKHKPHIELIIEAVQRYKLSKTVRDGFVCHPTTWINEGRWSDEIELSDYDKGVAVQTHTGMSAADTLAIQLAEAQREYDLEHGVVR
jgi:hypothetical protein